MMTSYVSQLGREATRRNGINHASNTLGPFDQRHRPKRKQEAYRNQPEEMDSEPKPMTRRTVVSSFIFKFPPDGGPQVALFRRSDKVRTYQ